MAEIEKMPDTIKKIVLEELEPPMTINYLGVHVDKFSGG